MGGAADVALGCQAAGANVRLLFKNEQLPREGLSRSYIRENVRSSIVYLWDSAAGEAVRKYDDRVKDLQTQFEP